MNSLHLFSTGDLAKILWDYHHMHHSLKKVDCIIALGSNDLRVAERAAQLFLDGYAPILVLSGAYAHKNDLLDTGYGMSEAAKFAEVAIGMGVPAEKIFLEEKATNTGENCTRSIELLTQKGYIAQTFLLVQKPYMERRTYATFQKLFPSYNAIVASPNLSFDEWMNKSSVPIDVVINLMVGDLQRVKVYPEKGFQIYQEIPQEVWQSYEELVNRGFNKHLIKE